jgi:hypothetical protein
MKKMSYWKVLVVVDEAPGGEAGAGIAGANEPCAAPTLGDTFVVGTAVAELTPRLPIS